MKSNVNSGYYVVLFIIVVFQVQLLFFLTDRLWQREISRAALLILKRLRKRGGSIWGISCGFSKNMSSKERVRPCFWYYHKSHLSWKFNWNFSSRSEDMKNNSFNIRYFHRFLIDFSDFLTFPCYKEFSGVSL